MIYRDNYGMDKLSILGFGCMRFPKKGNGFDIEEIEKEIKYAIEKGVNYFDTAYAYPGNEEALGMALSNTGLRDKVYIATKMPHYFIKDTDDLEKKFAEQLRRLKTDHVDYYLMHMLPDVKTWNHLVEKGVDKWLEEKRSQRKISRIGFSYHGNTDTFLDILNSYNWEFCQIQYNYMDETSQAGREGLMAAHEKGIPIIIMEPLRGGRLVNDLPKEADDIFRKSGKDRSPAEWALRWLWDQQEVSVVLSGMNSMDMVKENVRIASETIPGSMTEDDFAVIEDVKAAINSKMKVGCTGCRYCMPCPKGVDIPGAFRCYNVSYTDNYFVGVKEYFMCTTMKNEPSLASQCIECGKCEQHCPQGIAIRKELKNVKKRFENPAFKLITKFVPGRLK